MADLFHEDVPWEFIDDVICTIEQTPQHTYQILTKRPDQMMNYFGHWGVPDNVWLGVTVCNQEEADEKIPMLDRIEHLEEVVRFISIEPMLSPINLHRFLYQFRCWGCKYESLEKVDGFVCPRCNEEHMGSQPFSKMLDWVIVGGETGANARPMDVEWARDLRDQCRRTDTPFFFKQMAGKQPIPDDLQIREFPNRGGLNQ
jgi:protein gp37